MSDASVTGLLNAVKAACAFMKPGFIGLTEFTDMKLPGLPDIAQKIQMTLLEAGVWKLASVWKHKSFAKVVVGSSARGVEGGEYSEKRKVFKNRVEADAWVVE